MTCTCGRTVGRLAVLTVVLALVLEVLGVRPCLATWRDGGNPVGTADLDEAFPVLADDSYGGIFAAWQQFGRIYAQHLAPDGEVWTGWSPTIGVEVAPDAPPAPYQQCAPRIVKDGTGGAFVLWHDGRNSSCAGHCSQEPREIFALRILADGSVARGWPPSGLRVGSSFGDMLFANGSERLQPNSLNTVAVGDGRGGFVVAWQESPAYSGDSLHTIRAQRVSARGELLWGERGVLACRGTGGHVFPVLESGRTGGVFILWEERPIDGGQATLRLQSISERGRIRWGANGRSVSDSPAGNADHRLVASQPGELVATWSFTLGGVTHVRVRRIARLGAPGGGADEDLEVATIPACLPQPRAVFGLDQRVWVSWLAPLQDGRTCIRVDRRSLRPSRRGREQAHLSLCLGDSVAGENSALRAVPDGRGGVFLCWLEGRFAPRAVWLSSDGVLGQGWLASGNHLDDPVSGSYQLEAISDERGVAFVSWQRQRDAPSNFDQVVVQSLRPSGIGEVLVGPPRIREAEATAARLRPEARPAVFVMSRGTVCFRLNAPADVRCRVYDVMGRTVGNRDLGALEAGEHEVRVSDLVQARSGLLFTELRARDFVNVVRCVVIR